MKYRISRISSVTLLKAIALLAVAIGVVLRIAVFLQNRNLIIDEANLARNLHERGFLGLTKPLHYEQFAPPLWLWAGKLSMLVFGAYEWSLRLYSFFCGILGLWLFYLLLRRFHALRAAWYPLLLMATGGLYLRYATEFKQYSSDIVVALCLLLMALHLSIKDYRPLRFAIIWTIAGSVAIWLSMPSVFVLAGVACYYGWQCLKQKSTRRLAFLTIACLCWLGQFIFYYYAVLRPQIHSDFLQRVHETNFLYLLPRNSVQWQQDMDTLGALFGTLGGHWTLSMVTNILFLCTGFYLLGKRDKALLFLFGLPVGLLLLAAGLRQFSLLPRVSLFIYPYLLFTICIGLDYFLSLRYVVIKVLLVACCCINLFNYNELNWLFNPMRFETVTESYAWLKRRHIPSNQTFVHSLGTPQLIYHTSIHPDSADWNWLKDAHVFYWNTNMDSLCGNITGQSAFLFSWVEDWDIQRCREAFNRHFTVLDSNTAKDRKAYWFKRKDW